MGVKNPYQKKGRGRVGGGKREGRRVGRERSESHEWLHRRTYFETRDEETPCVRWVSPPSGHLGDRVGGRAGGRAGKKRHKNGKRKQHKNNLLQCPRTKFPREEKHHSPRTRKK